jgi:hypothetical protein
MQADLDVAFAMPLAHGRASAVDEAEVGDESGALVLV